MKVRSPRGVLGSDLSCGSSAVLLQASDGAIGKSLTPDLGYPRIALDRQVVVDQIPEYDTGHIGIAGAVQVQKRNTRAVAQPLHLHRASTPMRNALTKKATPDGRGQFYKVGYRALALRDYQLSSINQATSRKSTTGMEPDSAAPKSIRRPTIKSVFCREKLSSLKLYMPSIAT